MKGKTLLRTVSLISQNQKAKKTNTKIVNTAPNARRIFPTLHLKHLKTCEQTHGANTFCTCNCLKMKNKNVASTIVFNCVQLKMVEKRSEKRKHSSINKSGSGAASELKQQTIAQFASLRSVTLHSIANFLLQKVRLQLTGSLQNAENSVLNGGFRVVHVH